MRPSNSIMASVRASQGLRKSNMWSSNGVATGSTASRAFVIHSLHTFQREGTINARLPTKHYSTSPPPNVNGPGVHHTIHQHSPNNTTATITVSNPAKLNIVNSALLDQFVKICTTLSNNPTLRAVILTGDPTKNKTPSFIGGADIKEMHSLDSSSSARAFITKVHETCQALRNLPVPVIAKIDGLCLGGGLEIAVSCDLRIATEKSSFAMPEVRVGIPSVVEAALLPGLIGMGRARRLLYLAETIGAIEAERWGLIEKVVKDKGELENGVEEWIDAICEMGPKAMRSQKQLMLGWENQTADEGIQAGVEAFAEAYAGGGEEPREFMGRFVNRKR